MDSHNKETVSVEENIANGQKALKKVIENQEDVVNAMYRQDVGDIDFVWGTTGRGAKFKGGYGIAHIIAKRDADYKKGISSVNGENTVKKLIEVIAKGADTELQKSANGAGEERLKIHYDGYTAILSSNSGGNSWLLTGWEDIESKETTGSASSEGYDSTTATTATPTLTRRNGETVVSITDNVSQTTSDVKHAKEIEPPKMVQPWIHKGADAEQYDKQTKSTWSEEFEKLWCNGKNVKFVPTIRAFTVESENHGTITALVAAKENGSILSDFFYDNGHCFYGREVSSQEDIISFGSLENFVYQRQAEVLKSKRKVKSETGTESKLSAVTKIEDFGEKIGGARKDYAAKAESKSELEGNTEEAEEKVKPVKSEDSIPQWRQHYIIHKAPGKDNEYTIEDTKVKKSRIHNFYKSDIEEARFASEDEAEKAIAIREARKKFSCSAHGQNGYCVYKRISDTKRYLIRDDFKSYDEAQKYIDDHAEELLNTKTIFGESDLALPPIEVQKKPRTGNEDYLKGKSATSEMFVNTFGFKGVQFGNWNSQQERQEVMNNAYEGMLDLAKILNVPPQIISLNGELSLAFGARGQGLSGARAHYEPMYLIINLTKMKGAGSLAHEWMHAIDHYMAIKAGLISTERDTDNALKSWSISGGKYMLSDLADYEIRKLPLNKDLIESFIKLRNELKYARVEKQSDVEAALNWVSKAQSNLDEKLSELRKYVSSERKYGLRKSPATEEQLERFNAIAMKIATAKSDTQFDYTALGWVTPAIDEMGKLVKEITGRGFTKKDDRLISLVDRTRILISRQKALAEAQGGATQTETTLTNYYRSNHTIDSGRASDYWTKPTELLARGFSAYIEDALSNNHAQSNFLSYGSDNRLHIFGKPFPEGDERVKFNANYERFFKAVAKEVETNRQKTGKVFFSVRASVKKAEETEKHIAADDSTANNVITLTADELTGIAKKSIPNAKNITADGDTVTVELANGSTLTINLVDEIIATQEDLACAGREHGKVVTSNKDLQGSMQTIGLNALMQLTKDSETGTIDHEVMELAKAVALTNKENAILDKHMTKEQQCDSYRDWQKLRKQGKGGAFGLLWRKIQAFADGIKAFFGDVEAAKRKALRERVAPVESIFEKVASGEVWEREKNGIALNNNYSVTNTQITAETRVPVIDVTGLPMVNVNNNAINAAIAKTLIGKTFRIIGSNGIGRVASVSDGKHVVHSSKNPYRMDNIRRQAMSVIEDVLNNTIYIEKHKDLQHRTKIQYIELFAAVKDRNNLTRFRIVAKEGDKTAGEFEVKDVKFFDIIKKEYPLWPYQMGTQSGSILSTISVAELLAGVNDRNGVPYINSNGGLNYDVKALKGISNYSVRDEKLSSTQKAARVFSNSERKGMVQSAKDWIATTKKDLYKNWVDKNDSLHGLDVY